MRVGSVNPGTAKLFDEAEELVVVVARAVPGYLEREDDELVTRLSEKLLSVRLADGRCY